MTLWPCLRLRPQPRPKCTNAFPGNDQLSIRHFEKFCMFLKIFDLAYPPETFCEVEGRVCGQKK